MTPDDEPMIELGGNENPLGASPRVREAILRELDQLHRYPPGDEALRAALATHHGRGLTGGHVVTSASGSEIIRVRSTLENGLPGALRVTAGLDAENERFLEAFARGLGRSRARSVAR